MATADCCHDVSAAHVPTEPLGVETVVVEGQAVLRLAGELDMATAPLFEEALAGVHEEGLRTLIVDLAELTFIDSSGLNQLVVALKRQRENGGEVLLRSPQPSTLRVLEMVGLTKLFSIV